MTRRRLREKIAALLRESDFAALVELAGQEKSVAEVLLQFLYDPQDIWQWRALEGLGHVAGVHPEKPRAQLRRRIDQPH